MVTNRQTGLEERKGGGGPYRFNFGKKHLLTSGLMITGSS